MEINTVWQQCVLDDIYIQNNNKKHESILSVQMFFNKIKNEAHWFWFTEQKAQEYINQVKTVKASTSGKLPEDHKLMYWPDTDLTEWLLHNRDRERQILVCISFLTLFY